MVPLECIPVLESDEQSLLSVGRLLNSWDSAAISGTCPEDREAISETRSNCFQDSIPWSGHALCLNVGNDGGKELSSVSHTNSEYYHCFPLMSPACGTEHCPQGVRDLTTPLVHQQVKQICSLRPGGIVLLTQHFLGTCRRPNTVSCR